MFLRLLSLVPFLCAVSSALAQAPGLSGVWPPGAVRGSRVEARIEGTNLGAATSVLIGGQGVKAQMGAPAPDGNSLSLTVEVATDAPVGPREIRVVTPKGLSNPVYLWVDTMPPVEEAEPNSQPAQAVMLSSLPRTICGRMNTPEDVDWYAFRAEAGETLVFDICANRFFSPIDACLELRDEKGRFLDSAMEGYDRDPRLIHTFKAAGTYRLQVRDTMYRGGAGFFYLLHVGRLPVITELFPPGGRCGETLTAQVRGANLGDMKTLTVDLPPDMPRNQPWYVVPQTPSGPALPVTIVGDENPQFVESGVSAADRPLVLPALPVTVNGRIGAAKETDHYRFHAEANRPLTLALKARSIGSRLHAFLRLYDPAGKEVANSEDQIGRDPRLIFTPPAAGDYRVEVSGIEPDGGSDYFYRLAVNPPETPDFTLSASPDILTFGRGQTVVVSVNAERRGNFDGEIEVKVEGAPNGVTVSSLVLGSGQSAGKLTLTAGADIPLANGLLRIVGEAMPDGKTPVRRIAVPVASLPRPGEGRLVPRIVAFQMATVTEDAPLYSLSLERTDITLAPGETVMLRVFAARKPNDNNANPPIALQWTDLPPGVSAEAPTIPEKQGEITTKITAAGDAKPVIQNALLSGKLGENVQFAPALRVTIRPK